MNNFANWLSNPNRDTVLPGDIPMEGDKLRGNLQAGAIAQIANQVAGGGKDNANFQIDMGSTDYDSLVANVLASNILPRGVKTMVTLESEVYKDLRKLDEQGKLTDVQRITLGRIKTFFDAVAGSHNENTWTVDKIKYINGSYDNIYNGRIMPESNYQAVVNMGGMKSGISGVEPTKNKISLNTAHYNFEKLFPEFKFAKLPPNQRQKLNQWKENARGASMEIQAKYKLAFTEVERQMELRGSGDNTKGFGAGLKDINLDKIYKSTPTPRG